MFLFWLVLVSRDWLMRSGEAKCLTNLSIRISFCFLRVAVRRAEVSKASNHGDGPRLVNLCKMVTCVLQRNSRIGWFLKRPGLDGTVFNPHFAVKVLHFVRTDFLALCSVVSCSIHLKRLLIAPEHPFSLRS